MLCTHFSGSNHVASSNKEDQVYQELVTEQERSKILIWKQYCGSTCKRIDTPTNNPIIRGSGTKVYNLFMTMDTHFKWIVIQWMKFNGWQRNWNATRKSKYYVIQTKFRSPNRVVWCTYLWCIGKMSFWMKKWHD